MAGRAGVKNSVNYESRRPCTLEVMLQMRVSFANIEQGIVKMWRKISMPKSYIIAVPWLRESKGGAKDEDTPSSQTVVNSDFVQWFPVIISIQMVHWQSNDLWTGLNYYHALPCVLLAHIVRMQKNVEIFLKSDCSNSLVLALSDHMIHSLKLQTNIAGSNSIWLTELICKCLQWPYLWEQTPV